MNVLTVNDIMELTQQDEEYVTHGLVHWLEQGMIEISKDGKHYRATKEGFIRANRKRFSSGWGS